MHIQTFAVTYFGSKPSLIWVWFIKKRIFWSSEKCKIILETTKQTFYNPQQNLKKVFLCFRDGRNLPIKLSCNSVCFNSKLTSDHNDLPFKSKWMGMVSRKVFPKAIPRISTRCSVVFICLLVFLLLNTGKFDFLFKLMFYGF